MMDLTPSSSKTDKNELNRTLLREHGTIIHEAVPIPESTGRPLPELVNRVRRTVLNFNQMLHPNTEVWFGRERTSLLRGRSKDAPNDQSPSAERDGISEHIAVQEGWSLVPPQTAYISQDRVPAQSPDESAKDYAKMELIAKMAHDHLDRMEFDWVFFLRKHICVDYTRSYLTDGSSPADELFDEYTVCQEVMFTEHQAFRSEEGNKKNLTGPKPDLTYGFPIRRSLQRFPPGLRDDDVATNFSLDVLRQLRAESSGTGVNQSPLIAAPHRLGHSSSSPHSAGDLCFPWAVVEAKHGNVSEKDVEACYCQAANAATVALKLTKALFNRAPASQFTDLPPILALTCIGPKVKVWLLFHTQEDGDVYDMVCIWATSLVLTWGVYSVKKIIENMQFWAARVLRPAISHQISLIRTKLPKLNVTSIQSTEDLHGIYSKRASGVELQPGGNPQGTDTTPVQVYLPLPDQFAPETLPRSCEGERETAPTTNENHTPVSVPHRAFGAGEVFEYTFSMNVNQHPVSSDFEQAEYQTPRTSIFSQRLLGAHQPRLQPLSSSIRVQDWQFFTSRYHVYKTGPNSPTSLLEYFGTLGLHESSQEKTSLEHDDQARSAADVDGSESVEDERDSDADPWWLPPDEPETDDGGTTSEDDEDDHSDSSLETSPHARPEYFAEPLLTLKDIANLRDSAISALDGSCLIALPEFRLMVDQTSNERLIGVIFHSWEMFDFQLKDESDMETMKLIASDVRHASGLPREKPSRHENHIRLGYEPRDVQGALQSMQRKDDAATIRCLTTDVLKILEQEQCIEALKAGSCHEQQPAWTNLGIAALEELSKLPKDFEDVLSDIDERDY